MLTTVMIFFVFKIFKNYLLDLVGINLSQKLVLFWFLDDFDLSFVQIDDIKLVPIMSSSKKLRSIKMLMLRESSNLLNKNDESVIVD